MDIRSKSAYPASALSNFAPHPFVMDGVECASMEGFLQSLKFKEIAVQKEVCKLVGLAAKRRGKGRQWQRHGLWWQGRELDRMSDEYQDLLDRAYGALAKNEKFRRALKATGSATLTHSLGRTKKRETILTRSEFCRRLTNLRTQIETGQI